ncbi:nuclear transport factor 2 family protein [Endozoicomonadaceae bacterium StTr2]
MNIIIEHEIALHQYEVRTNREQVLKLLHPDFQEVGESGNSYNLSSILELLGSEQPSGNRIHSQDYESIKLGPDVYLLLYKSATVDSEGHSSHFAKRSSIWMLTETGWQMKYHQGTPCEPFLLRQQSS